MTSGPPKTAQIIALDIGGTKIAAGLVDPKNGIVSEAKQIATGAGQGRHHIAQVAASLVAELSSLAHEASTVAIGFCEIVDRKGAIRSRSMIDWMDFDLQHELRTNLPIHLVSDVRAAALAEAQFGAARGAAHALYISIGTGISSTLLMGGKPYAGAHGAALVLSTAETLQHCPSCGATSHYSLERVASGAGLGESYKEIPGLTAEQIIARAQANEPAALALVTRAARLAGQAIAQLANCTDPELIVIGGGLGRAKGLYWQLLSGAIADGLWREAPAKCRIVQSVLGPELGVLGAGLAAVTGVH